MANYQVVAVGASAGGFQALIELAKGLPGDFPAAVLVTIHLHPAASNVLPDLIDRAGALHAAFAREGDEIAPGCFYIAPPDGHLLVERGRAIVRRGPRENGARPAIDPMFRSVAAAYGSHAIGVILTGALNDGSSGLRAIKACGGIAVVQDPRDAAYPEMPTSALAVTPADHVVALREMVPLLKQLVAQRVPSDKPPSPEVRREIEIAAQRDSDMATVDRLGERSVLTCPECHGLLWEIKDGSLVRYRCHVGHAFTLESLEAEQATELDRAMSSALRALSERIHVIHRLANEARQMQHERMARRWESRAQEYEQQAEVIRAALVKKPINGELQDDIVEPDDKRRRSTSRVYSTNRE
jgi:two-component system chemotaxis response regulator CheB